LRRAIFLDRDGVIVKQFKVDGKSFPPRNFKDFRLYPYVRERLKELKNKFLIFVITNQPDVKKGLMKMEDLNLMHLYLKNNLPIKEIYTCLHLKDENCICRKPSDYFIKKAKNKYKINLNKSILIGDRESDIRAGNSSGCHSLFIDRNYDEYKPTKYKKKFYSFNQAAKFIISEMS
tara:strand:+ start:353 stop:880 length:528 start_codon:yes stop_codon:yes gene_type:complete